MRLVGELKPTWFVFENVKGITFTKTDVVYQICNDCGERELAPFNVRQDFKSFEDDPNMPCAKCQSDNTSWDKVNESGGSLRIIFNEFEKLGYSCSFKVLNAADYGAPQIRERLIIVGNKMGKKMLWPEPTHSKPAGNKNQRELFSETNKRPWNTMLNSLWEKGHAVYGKIDKSSAKLWVKNVVRPHDEPVTWSLNRPSPTIGAHQGAKLAFAPLGVPDKQLYRQQWHTRGRRQSDTPAVTVEHKYLSDEELLRLQTFPEWWYLHGTRMQRAFQIGNAVPPILAKAIGQAILKSERQT